MSFSTRILKNGFNGPEVLLPSLWIETFILARRLREEFLRNLLDKEDQLILLT